jgi:hypothetical protein
MTIDIKYIDLSLHGSSVEDSILNDDLELFFQEIELSVQIAPNEIWGISEAINLSRYVFNQYVTITQIKNEISNYISNNCQHANYFNYNISVETLKNSDNKDLIYIVFNVDANDQNGNAQQYLQKFLIGN